MAEINFLEIIDLLGTAAFAISGARQAIVRKLDVFGVLIISFVTAVGGGTLRDVLIGNTPVAWMRNEQTIAIILAGATVTMLVNGLYRKLRNTLFLFDSLGLGLFTLAGVDVALQAGFSPGMAIALGTISACFGGVIRDVLLNQVPLIFHKEIYASACIAGGVLFFGLRYLGIDNTVNQVLCICSIVLIRMVAVRYQLSLPPIQKNTNT